MKRRVSALWVRLPKCCCFGMAVTSFRAVNALNTGHHVVTPLTQQNLLHMNYARPTKPVNSLPNQTGSASPSNNSEEMVLQDVASKIASLGGGIPLQQLLKHITPRSRDWITRSGKGVEGWLKGLPDEFVVEVVQNPKPGKMVRLSSKSVRKNAELVDEPAIPPPPKVIGRKVFKQTVSQDAVKVQTSTVPHREMKPPSAVAPIVNEELHKILVYKMVLWTKYNTYKLASLLFGKSDSLKANILLEHAKVNPDYFVVADAGRTILRREPGDGFDLSTLSAASTFRSNAWTTHWCAGAVPSNVVLSTLLQYIPVHFHDIRDCIVCFDPEDRKIFPNDFYAYLADQPRFIEIKTGCPRLQDHYLRRAVRLHPAEHGMTQEEANIYVQKYVMEARPLSVIRHGKPRF